ncbi:alpha/beta hydrolase [Nocardia sp. NBC_01730]|uniref:alpha/beta fold hydrolase n=1 Tax=Nocardia sp. NBC_01730 TaxID=2975998 RepID=UPI002E150E4D|nr:alpha/beta hydrolase [Nocardia sp. NBC_01730]
MTNASKSPTLVFIPCMSGAPWDISRFDSLSERPARLLTLPEAVDDMEVYANFVADAVADLDDYVLIGDSFGAQIGLASAVRQPNGLRGLVMSGGFAANPVTSPFWNTAMRTMGKMRGGAYQHIVLRAHAHRLASPFDGEGQVPWNKAESRRVFRENTPAESYGARITAALSAYYVDKLDQVTVPTLILTPEHDVIVGEAPAKVMLDGIPDATEVVLARTGHMFRFSHPGTYSVAVARFLTERVDHQEAVHAGR